MKRILLHIFAVFCIALIGAWGAAFVRCEYLTARYCDEELYAACAANPMIGEIEKIKILDRIAPGCLKLYVKTADTGNILVVEDTYTGTWQEIYWNTVWSRSGSADGFIWPYFR